MGARVTNRLTASQVKAIKAPGTYLDGDGLRLIVNDKGRRYWYLRFKIGGRERELGLGNADHLGLADARTKAQEARKLIREGKDPIEAKKASIESAAPVVAIPKPSFKFCAEEYIKTQKAGWKNAKHADQWENTLRDYAFPIIGTMSVDTIELDHIKQVLDPIWTTKTETASRVRSRIELVLSWAAVHGYRTTDNPARWKGLLSLIYPTPSKVSKVEHHPALPYAETPAFWKTLKAQFGHSVRALQLIILTAARSGEVLQASWDEFDMVNKVWTVPAGRMKGGREHRKPLSDAALEILELQQEARKSKYVFPGARKDKPLSNMATEMVLRRLKRDDITTHGFRSSFRDWAAECTNYPSEVVEMALAHAVGDKVEAAYRRGDLFQKRVDLMRDWCAFIGA